MTEVLIVGAGPTGLTLAVDLRRRGIDVRIIDAKDGPSQHSKALGVFPRTLEVLEDLQAAPAMVAQGRPLRGLLAKAGSERLADIDLSGLRSPFPFVLSLPQSDTERILLNRLTDLGTCVEWNTELLDINRDVEAEHAESVVASVRLPDGTVELVQTPWVVGCDGAHSRVRTCMGFEYSGYSIPADFVFADARADWSLPVNQVQLFLAPQGAFAAIPLPLQGFWRIIAQMPHEVPEEQITLPLFEQLARDRAGLEVRLSEPLWTTSFGIHQRKVRKYRIGRVLLAGDAAHNHSPVGGQGMNYGIQDAYNLGWKLAMVVRGAAGHELLDSYEAEREPLARKLLTGTGLLTRFATLHNSWLQRTRNAALQLISKARAFHEMVETTLSEIGVNYEHSPIVATDNQPNSFHKGPLCGDRAPLLGEVGQVGQDGVLTRMLFRKLLHGGRHVLIEFRSALSPGEYLEEEPDSLGGAVTHVRVLHRNAAAELGDYVDLHRTILEDYGVIDRAFYLIRPDGYIAYRGKTPPELSVPSLGYLASEVAAAT